MILNILSKLNKMYYFSIIIIILIILRPEIYYSTVLKFINYLLLTKEQIIKQLIPKSKKLEQLNFINENKITNLLRLDDHLNNKKENVQECIILTNNTISNILVKKGINISIIIKLAKKYPILHQLKIGQKLLIFIDKKSNLQSLIWKRSVRETRIYNLVNNKFIEQINILPSQRENVILIKQLNTNFVSSMKNIGLTKTDIHMLIQAFKWKFNLNKFSKKDRFVIIFSKEILNGIILSKSMLGIRLQVHGKDYYAFRAQDNKIYNLDNFNLSNKFIKFPVKKFFRISSHFNLNRIHPVTGKITPHRGIDFATPINTPVLTVGDGEVLTSKREKYAGNYVTIRHSNQCITRYMHLNRLLVKSGQKVKCGDCIALSGNTGRSTGPHLHFEIWINKKSVDPLTVNLSVINKNLINQTYLNFANNIKLIMPQLKF